MNFFLIDALAYLTRFGGSLIINQLEIRKPTRLEFEIFFSIDALAYLTRFGALLLSPGSRFEPSPNLQRKMNFFLIDALAHSTRFGALLLSTSSRFETRPVPTRPDLNSKFFFPSTTLPTRLFGALLSPSLIPSSRFEPRANLHRKMNFFLIDDLAQSTRFGALLLSSSSRFETRPDPTRPDPTRLQFEMFFFDRRLCLLDCSGLY